MFLLGTEPLTGPSSLCQFGLGQLQGEGFAISYDQWEALLGLAMMAMSQVGMRQEEGETEAQSFLPAKSTLLLCLAGFSQSRKDILSAAATRQSPCQLSPKVSVSCPPQVPVFCSPVPSQQKCPPVQMPLCQQEYTPKQK